MRLCVKYSRENCACYISHLDMQRTFGRALRRGKINVLFSLGFNPHIRMSFASPLSVGYATKGDYFEVMTQEDEDISQVKEKLNSVLTKDIRIISVIKIEESVKKLMAINHSAAYEINFLWKNDFECGIIKDAIKEIDNKICEDNVYLTKDRKDREVDISPLIYEMKVNESNLYVRLANSQVALNPAVLAEEILKVGHINTPYLIVRQDCFCTYKGNVTNFEEIGN